MSKYCDTRGSPADRGAEEVSESVRLELLDPASAAAEIRIEPVMSDPARELYIEFDSADALRRIERVAHFLSNSSAGSLGFDWVRELAL